MSRQRAMSAANFERIYGPVAGPDGSWARDRADVPADVEPTRVWTLVDGDNGEAYIVPGWHVVNAFAHVVTERPWREAEDADLVARW